MSPADDAVGERKHQTAIRGKRINRSLADKSAFIKIGANKHRMRHKPAPECPRRMENTAPVLRDRLI